jgi:hypothetical protein
VAVARSVVAVAGVGYVDGGVILEGRDEAT